ncbi:MAG: TrmH family RNA methyltransferase [Anaerolineae bacterium]|jgi:TrmH family RNA methyltransferase|nr:RNA methyltransferase [Chloroflexota bacterium]
MQHIAAITSLQNPHVRLIEKLTRKKRDRYRAQQYIAEGYRLVRHALQRGCRPAFVLMTAEFAGSAAGEELVAALAAVQSPMAIASPEVFQALADTVTPQGVLAVLPMPQADPARLRQAQLVLVLDALRTPGNLGTILRTAQATGVDAVVCAPGTVDPFSPKAVRGGMGAHIDLPLYVDVPWEGLPALLGPRRILAATAEGDTSLWQADLTGPLALVIGSEAHGVGTAARSLAQGGLRIPMAAGAESLNAAIAAAALLFEAQRQRSLATAG